MELSAPKIQFNRAKMAEAVHFVCSLDGDSKIGNVKLHKILYFSDMFMFLERGNPITGVEYIKQKFGPTARYLSSTVSQLEKDGTLSVSEDRFYGYMKKSYRVNKEYKPRNLSEEERGALRDWAEWILNKTAKEVSDISHNEAWKSVDLGEVIPYHSVYKILPAEVEEEDLAWAKETAKLYAINAR